MRNDMNTLEKILEEIEQRINYYRDNATLTYVDVCAGLREAETIIHSNYKNFKYDNLEV